MKINLKSNVFLIITMSKVKSIQISKIEEEKKLGFSMLKFNIKGENINHIIVNSIKRIIQSDIPVYAYNNFDITENSSIFNNNYIKHHLQNIDPVCGILSISMKHGFVIRTGGQIWEKPSSKRLTMRGLQ